MHLKSSCSSCRSQRTSLIQSYTDPFNDLTEKWCLFLDVQAVLSWDFELLHAGRLTDISRAIVVPIKTESGTTNSVYFSNTSAIMTAVLKRNKPQGTVKYLCFSEQSRALSSKSRKMKDNQAPAKCFPLRDVITERWAFPRFLVQTVKWYHVPVIFLTDNDLVSLSSIAWSPFVRFSPAEQQFSANRPVPGLLFEQRQDCCVLCACCWPRLWSQLRSCCFVLHPLGRNSVDSSFTESQTVAYSPPVFGLLVKCSSIPRARRDMCGAWVARQDSFWKGQGDKKNITVTSQL